MRERREGRKWVIDKTDLPEGGEREEKMGHLTSPRLPQKLVNDKTIVYLFILDAMFLYSIHVPLFNSLNGEVNH